MVRPNQPISASLAKTNHLTFGKGKSAEIPCAITLQHCWAWDKLNTIHNFEATQHFVHFESLVYLDMTVV